MECDINLCKAAYTLCQEYGVYSIDALYLKMAIDMNTILVSLDDKDFIDKVKRKKPPIEAYHPSEFPY